MTIQDVSANLGIQWKTAKEIEKQRLRCKYKNMDYSNVRFIAIDEFSIKKGHVYQAVVINLESREVIYVGEGRSQGCLDGFWVKVKKQNVSIEAIAVDMWPTYLNSIMEHSPNSLVVYDKFHIVKKMNKALSDVRKKLYRQETLAENKKLLKGTRWLLLYYSDKLPGKAKDRLQEALGVNKPLAEAYYLKEELGLLWNQLNAGEALDFLKLWCEQAMETKLGPLIKFTNMPKAHRTSIVNWYKHLISTGPLEGMNNKIKVLKKKAYGYRDLESFNLKILDIHNNRYALT